ncbi:probable LRR receptor-like serine/threonine-protein kinase At1g51820 isoform X2 [Arabidopsis lyrata subsp. lyrata]|uniref:probable LRR receptor-like serine/threonine-protein kinase At1g51820 isoform X2 n=1 Tax=Arabidopsis lyrata subsp. lyrata TaxID=81972 RepID=UPI000A29A5A0|nr:probable LRR receptor-like serine/threonine-protein kinase At1g51820 isoform X2 [Arabidopsis lyrata subsp. lyrata]|eukprot:XP_020870263.1 probable LRR receptor-like serine/threonine-protein kinase At1g51820 isoform X2 [Arabidopsis lyrata subsp. lyrata]
MERHCVFVATFMLILHLVQAQDQPGFINVDCGLLPRDSPYNALGTGLAYTSDAGLVSSGKTGRIAKEFEANNSTPNLTLRYFPDGLRNCYNLNVSRDTNYMIKATFVYGNYDGLNDVPNFELYLGPNLWATVSRSETIEEIIHVTKSNSLQVCLAKTAETIPYINILELRPLRKNVYVTESGSLKLLFRKYFSESGRTIRYPDDIYDRVWHASFLENNWAQVTTTLDVNVTDNYELSQDVMATGATPLNDSETLNITWNVEPPTTKVYSYMHFAELETLRANDTREFNVMLNGNDLFGPYSPIPLKTETETNLKPEECDDGACILQLVKTSKSTLPPLLNAIEAFTVIDFPQLETIEDDAAAIKNVQDAYGLKRITWQGDPCVPKQYSWDGLKCNYSDTTPPIINYLDLSGSGLTGIITPAIKNLTHLEILALPNNNLSGEVPEFLADLKSIMVIGPVPLSLLQKKGLMLHLDGNPQIICSTGSCMHKGEGEQKSILVPVVASIVSLAVIIGALVLFLVFRKKKASKVEGPLPSYMQESDGRSQITSEPAIVTKSKKFTYSQVVIMTNNCQRILGKGGFGIVYHGFVNGIEQVAVKILSHSSSQGYKQFKAEVELLLRVHHKNLVGLVGYCDEGENMALIYEYMANGDLKEHMSGRRNRFVLNWGTRLKIVIDSAQGLEYLHNGCKPPMVHRDVKTTNILLNEHFEAKLADFGLSRSFPTGGETHVSTVVAGTPGYLDPEYYKTNRLTEKSDVYSFGIVLLEMITNRPVIDQSREKPYIAEWVGLMLTKGDIISIMDPSLNGDFDSGSVWKAVELAMSCLNPSSTRRPTMSQVVIALNECLVSENSRGGASRDMDSKSSIEVSLTFDTDVSPTAR